jgi:glycosyltransferase involved in cell wall biosynthesis
MKPRVAAVIPTIGRPELRSAVESVLAQTVPTRPIVVNDRPAFRTMVESTLDGLEYDYLETRGGVRAAVARNLGVEHSQEEYIGFLDDDDAWGPAKVELQLAALSATDGPSVASCLTLFRSSGGRSRTIPEVPFSPDMSMPSYLLDRSTVQLRRHFMQTSSLLGHRELFIAVPWNEGLRKHQDWDLLIRIADYGATITVVTDPLVLVRQGSAESVSSSADWKHSLAWFDTVRNRTDSASRGDFLASIVLRSALRARDWRGAWSIALRIARERPHAPAVLVGLSGIRG